MPCPLRSTGLIAFIALAMIAATHAQDPPKPADKPETPAKQEPLRDAPPQGDLAHPPVLEFKDEIKPLPPVAIPDDPPPHEGALIDLPFTVEPPDIIIVEVLEALPGRPITGERLVRPDGTISLGFYGDLNVRGLTLDQVKIKVILHLRKYFQSDEVLGLLIFEPDQIEVEVMPEDEPGKPRKKPIAVPEEAPDAEKKPEPEAKPAEKKEGRPSARLSRRGRMGSRPFGRPQPNPAQARPIAARREMQQDDKPAPPRPNPEKEMVEVEVVEVKGTWKIVPPVESSHVFVDINSFNTKVYYVQGDVGVPGRLPFTGKETVLDALNYAGGFVPTGEPADIHLYRPARGGKPAKDYKIDHEAILKGVATANLQIFPNDRLVVGRNPIVKKTVEIDRAASLYNSVLNSMIQYSFTARSLAAINTPPSGSSGGGTIKVNGQNMPLNLADPVAVTPAQRDALIKDWFEFFWSISSKDGGAMLDEKAFKDALMKKLTPESK